MLTLLVDVQVELLGRAVLALLALERLLARVRVQVVAQLLLRSELAVWGEVNNLTIQLSRRVNESHPTYLTY